MKQLKFAMVTVALAMLLGGCATAPVTKIIQAGEGVPIEPALLNKVEQELQLTEESYDAGDLAGAEQACVRAGRLIYGMQSPTKETEARYVKLASKCALWTVRINKVLHHTSSDLEPEAFTMSIPHNPRIERQLDLFLRGGRKSFSRWLHRSGKYVPILKQYFISEGLPGDLVYVALIESGFNPRNRSHKHAVGLFQFIKGTATMVGLKENSWIDERRHPEKAAEAAVKHLKSLYKEFGDWDLVLAAYNAGSGRVKRAMRNQGVKNYWQLSLPPETEAYVPRFYAAVIIAKEPVLYGFNDELEEVTDTEDVPVPGAVDIKLIADAAGVTLSVVKDLNPELTKGCTPPGDDAYMLKMPLGSKARFEKAFALIPEKNRYLSSEEIARRRFKGVYFVYKVKPGDSLFTIANKHHTTVAKLKKWNASTKTRKYIHPGQKLRIYRMR